MRDPEISGYTQTENTKSRKALKRAGILSALPLLTACGPMIELSFPSYTSCQTFSSTELAPDGKWDIVEGHGNCYSRTTRPGFNNFPPDHRVRLRNK